MAFALFSHQEDGIIATKMTLMLLILSLPLPIMLGLFELIKMSIHLVVIIIIHYEKVFAPKI